LALPHFPVVQVYTTCNIYIYMKLSHFHGQTFHRRNYVSAMIRSISHPFLHSTRCCSRVRHRCVVEDWRNVEVQQLLAIRVLFWSLELFVFEGGQGWGQSYRSYCFISGTILRVSAG
jgi:hypothetical protein